MAKYSEKSESILGLNSYILNKFFVILTPFKFISVIELTALLKFEIYRLLSLAFIVRSFSVTIENLLFETYP